jgi:flagellar assembly protein FliH
MTRIIRARDGGSPPRRRSRPLRTRVLRAAQIDAIGEAEQALVEARAEAEAILQRARQEAEKARARAVEEGRAEVAAVVATARARAVKQLEEDRRSLTKLAVRIAEKLLNQELALQPERVVGIVEGCLRDAMSARRIEVRVNPADLAVVEAALPRLGTLTEAGQLVVQSDAQIRRGGCVLASELGEIDGRLEAQLDAILRALQEGQP